MYERERKDIFKGYIGKLKKKNQTIFENILRSEERFKKFQAFTKSEDYE